MQNCVFPRRVRMALVRCLTVRHHHADRSTQVLLIEAERLRAFACEIHIRIHFHDRPPGWPFVSGPPMIILAAESCRTKSASDRLLGQVDATISTLRAA